MEYPEIIKDLIKLLDADEKLKSELEKSIDKAKIDIIPDLKTFLIFIVFTLMYYSPNEKIMSDKGKVFYYIITRSKYLKENTAFKKWLKEYVREYGRFLDSPESIVYLENFYDDPQFEMDDYYQPASGWMSFNQFFTRKPKPGKRPIDSIDDDDIIVSPVDGTFINWHPIKNSHVKAKGVNISIKEVLKSSQYKDDFSNGMYCFINLKPHNYHWYHTPISGKVLEVKTVPGDIRIKVTKDSQGKLHVSDGENFRIHQELGLLVLDTKNGLVAVICIGVGDVSSVTLLPEKDSQLYKGQDFGFFSYGGSDIIVLFSNPKVVFTAKRDREYRQGNKIGYFEK